MQLKIANSATPATPCNPPPAALVADSPHLIDYNGLLLQPVLIQTSPPPRPLSTREIVLEHCLDGQLLWFCLLIFILIRWHVQIHHIMDAIARRVADGEEFSLGPLHLGSVDDQRRGLEIRERVIAELIEVDDSPISRPAENEE